MIESITGRMVEVELDLGEHNRRLSVLEGKRVSGVETLDLRVNGSEKRVQQTFLRDDMPQVEVKTKQAPRGAILWGEVLSWRIGRLKVCLSVRRER